MEWSQSLNAPPFFDEGNYAFWKVRMRAFLCVVDESVWDSVENGYVKSTTAKFEWDKVALALANANSKAINAIFCGVSPDEFHRISHVKQQRRLGRSLKRPMRVPRKSRTRSFKCLPPNLKNIRWEMMGLSILSLDSSIRL